MKYIFIVNPHAGPHNSAEDIKALFKEFEGKYDCQIYETLSPGDATVFAKKWLDDHPDEEVRFIACGGDGTLNEVVSGVVGHEKASVACYPCGSGNDYVKHYGGKGHFLSIPALLEAPDSYVDVMKVNDRYCFNVCNFGFDTAVAKTMAKVRRKKLIGGKNSYYTGIVKSLFTAMRTQCRTIVDSVPLGISKLLLCTISNGSHVGSHFKCAPKSLNDDGLMEFCLVKPISRMRFFTLVGCYMKGQHLDNEKMRKILVYRRAKRIELRAPKGFMVTLDGELYESSHIVIENLHKAVRFAVPEGAKALNAQNHEELPQLTCSLP